MNSEEKNQALYEYQKATLEHNKKIKKKTIKKIICSIIIIPILIFFIFNNPLTIFFVEKKDIRYYDIRVNDYKLSVSEKIPDTTIISNWIVIPNGKTISFYNDKRNKNKIIKEKPYILSINSYTCFIPADNKRIKISCNENSAKDINKYENNDTSYTKMQILKYDYDSMYEYEVSSYGLSRTYVMEENSFYVRPCEEYTIIYDGKFTEDITSYVSDKSVYVIKLDFRYKNTKGTLSFGVLNDGENLLTL